MAVRTHHFALGDLSQNPFPAVTESVCLGYVEELLLSKAMIEVHRRVVESSTAISARLIFQSNDGCVTFAPELVDVRPVGLDPLALAVSLFLSIGEWHAAILSLVRAEGFEPPTCGLSVRCSTS